MATNTELSIVDLYAPSNLGRACFTINNPSVEEIEEVKSFLTEKAKFGVFQVEKGKEETPHIQGFVRLKRKMRFKSFKKLFSRAHVERAKGSDVQNLEYCTKQIDRVSEPFIIGEPCTTTPGERTDIKKARELILECESFDDVLMHDDENVIRLLGRSLHFCREIFNLRKVKTGKQLTIHKEWQDFIIKLIEEPPSDRLIYWFCDLLGGAGKSTFTSWLLDNHDAQRLKGKTKDIAHAWKNKKIAVFDYARNIRNKSVNYVAMEDLKNGSIFSPKYDSHSKIFKTPHVIVFSNHLPFKKAWSSDRYKVYKIKTDDTLEFIDWEDLPDE